MQWKLHLTVIAIMTIVLTLGYYLLRPEPKQRIITHVINAKHISIVEATWGLNCNRYINEKLKKNPFTTDATGKVTSEESAPPVPITPNNVFAIIESLCNKKNACTVSARSDILGNPYADCSKELFVSWRCFAYDILRSKTINENNSSMITCEPDDSSSLKQ